ncbi:MAG: hypothetical protein HY702_04315 [Gemmatimonadetes bacterium]|nr:hypothetical protein [Gemmatimonadota bacterium]
MRGGAFADHALDRAGARLSERDRRLAQELAYGVLRLRGRLDALLSTRVHRGLERLDPDVLDVLRLALYQLLELDRVPAYAVVDDAVEMARKVGGAGAAGLVNAVLRGVIRDGAHPEPAPDLERDPAAYLSTWGSHPRWLIERWLQRWDAEEVRALVEANNRRPSVYLAPVGITSGECIQRLREAGCSARPGPLARDIVEIDPGDLTSALATVPAAVQDPAAALVVDYAELPQRARTADLCAAPGGKAFRIAASGCRVVACDRSRRRLGQLSENLSRFPTACVSLVRSDAAHPPLRHVDAVLLDVPCTGTGTLRRRPDARWRLSPGDLEKLVALQRELLAAGAGIVRAGGLLVYATCSLEREENEEQVAEFLSERPEYTLEPPSGPFPEGTLTGRGELYVLPQRCGTDGAYAARLRRRGAGD